MSFNGSGTFVVNSTGNPVVTLTTISSTWANALTADLATGLSTAILKDGTQTITANIPWGSYKITGLGSGTLSTDAINLGQAQTAFVDSSYTTTATAATTTTLVYTSAREQYFTGATTQIVALPVASTMRALGQTFRIVNLSTGSLTVNSSGGNLVATIVANSDVTITCILLSGTAAASWDVKFTGTTAESGTGANARVVSPAFTTPDLGTPSAGVLSSCSAYAQSALTGLAAGISTFLGTPSSVNLKAAVTDETGSGALVFANTPTLVTPVLGAATGTSIALTGPTISLQTGYTLQGGVLQLFNNAGTLKSSFSTENSGAALGNFWGQVSGATATSTTVPTGTDSSTAMAGGGKVSTGTTNAYIFNTAAQVIASTPPPIVSVGYNDTGTGLIGIIQLTSRNVNGVTQIRWELLLYNSSTGAAVAINTTSIPSGKFVNFQIQGWIV